MKDKKFQKSKRFFWLICIVMIGLIISGYFFFKESGPAEEASLKESSPEKLTESQCRVKELTYYYSRGCFWCQKTKSEGTLTMIEQLGVKVEKIDVAIGPIRHQFRGVPTFAFDEEVYSGYRTFEQLAELLGCPSIK